LEFRSFGKYRQTTQKTGNRVEWSLRQARSEKPRGSKLVPADRNRDPSKFVDFAAKSSPIRVRYFNHAVLGDLTLCSCAFEANPGAFIGGSQITVALHTGAPYELVWRHEGMDRLLPIATGSANVTDAFDPVYLSWGNAKPEVDIIALEPDAVRRILASAGMNPNAHLRPTFGVRDKFIRQLADACATGLEEYGENDRLFADGIALSLVTHIFRAYSDAATPALVKGGLTPRDTKRVLAYIQEHLRDDIGLEDLASTVDLSTHYFTEAFRKAVGVPPYRYVLQQRVERAKLLLSQSELSVSQIADRAGFSSQAQLTTIFRRFVGTPPARYRRETK
jgi:AraC family transcriptional regulator